jgi:hypothetical protein
VAPLAAISVAPLSRDRNGSIGARDNNRKLMSQYHPDKLIGQGLPKDMIDVATEQAKEIQLAHDLIQKTRNI